MNTFTVSLFGHREIDDLRQLENLLSPIIRKLMLEKNYVTFLIGRNGEFDEYSASVIKRVQKEVGTEMCDITLVLPYMVKNIITLLVIKNYLKTQIYLLDLKKKFVLWVKMVVVNPV